MSGPDAPVRDPNGDESMRRLIIATTVLAALFGACGGDHDGRLGMTVTTGSDRVTDEAPFVVAGVLPDGPADRAGLKAGDRIVRVHGSGVEGLTHDEVAALLGGPAEAAVAVEAERGGALLTFRIRRGN